MREDRLEGVRAVCGGLMMILYSVLKSDESLSFLELKDDLLEQLEGRNAQMSYF